MNKQETLEEAAEKYVEEDNNNRYYNDFIAGANYQAERMYSEEEVIRIARDAYAMGRNIVLVGAFNKWLEQFKNK
jgi:hypothetical protein